VVRVDGDSIVLVRMRVLLTRRTVVVVVAMVEVVRERKDVETGEPRYRGGKNPGTTGPHHWGIISSASGDGLVLDAAERDEKGYVP
jgi:hypothetical protein